MKFLCLLLITLIPFRLLACGHAGHAMVVAELAMSMLSDATRVKVERVLSGMTPAEAGKWMDEIRSDPKYKWDEVEYAKAYANLTQTIRRATRRSIV